MNRQPYQPYQPPAYQVPVYRAQGYQQPSYPQQGYQQMPNYPQPVMLSARYVTGKEEAIAASVMPDGNTWLFMDKARGRVYEKSIDPNTGFAVFNEYGYMQPQEQPTATAQWVPIESFNELMDRVGRLEAAMSKEAAE